jgi:hypothetical protein
MLAHLVTAALAARFLGEYHTSVYATSRCEVALSSLLRIQQESKFSHTHGIAIHAHIARASANECVVRMNNGQRYVAYWFSSTPEIYFYCIIKKVASWLN